MTIHNSDYGFIGLTIARIASQLKENININMTLSFNTELGNYIICSLFDGDKVINSFHLTNCDGPRDFMDKVFECCIEKELFKVPLDLKIID